MPFLSLSDVDQADILAISDHRGAAPRAWRALWEKARDLRVELDLARTDRRSVWAARLDDAVCRAERPLLIVANGLGCLATAWWARLSPASYVARVRGALLMAPTDAGAASAPEAARWFAQGPNTLLPFPSLVVGSRTDLRNHNVRVTRLAQGWGSRLVDAGLTRLIEHGARVPPAWAEGERLLDRLFDAMHDAVPRPAALREEAEPLYWGA